MNNFCAFALKPNSQQEQWERLLYYVNGRSIVTSEQFFLHEQGDIDPKAELEATIILLNSEDGELIACNYPARYSWIIENGYNVQTFNLDACNELNKFVDGFQKDSLSVVFASEYIDSPSSVFGHILLVFHDENKPLLTADTIHYAAETGEERFIKYAYKGLSGGYQGYFFRTPFHIIRNNYTIIEQRSLYFYKLDLSHKRIKFLIYYLYELRKAEFQYYFIKVNCAYHIAYLLDVAYGYGSSRYKQSLYVLPMDIIRAYKSKTINKFVLEATLLEAERLFDQMSSDERKEYALVVKGRRAINNELSERVKEILTIKYEYSFRRFRRIKVDYDKVVRLKFRNLIKLQTFKDSTLSKSKNKIGIGYYHSDWSEGIILQYRPIGRDMFENQFRKLQESEFVLMDTELLITNSEDVKINRLDIVGAKSVFSRSRLGAKTSWALNLGINRQNTLNEAAFDFNFGLGRGYSNARIGLSYLIGAGIQSNDSEGNGYLKPVLNLIYYPAKIAKLGFISFIKIGSDGNYEESAVFINIGFDKYSFLSKYVMTNSFMNNMAIFVFRCNL